MALTWDIVRDFLAVTADVIFLMVYSMYLSLEAFFNWIVPPPTKSLVGEVILITGSANGIGREICLRLADLGAILVCWDIQQTENESLVNELVGGSDNKAYAYQVDVGDRAQVEAAAARVKKEVGNVTMVINNAGIMPCHKFLSHNPKEIERAFQVNVLGHFWILREFLPGMLARKCGHIVTVCSAAGLIGTPNLVPYCGTKHAVNGYIGALKEELRVMPEQPNINFTTIYPFSCQTDLIRNITCNTRFPSLIPVLKPETVAEKLIDGIRRNYESVYVPGTLQFAAIMDRCLPSKVRSRFRKN